MGTCSAVTNASKNINSIEEATMKRTVLSLSCFLSLCMHVQSATGKALVLEGLFCTEKASVPRIMDMTRHGQMTLDAAILIVNKEKTDCVYARPIPYIIVNPVEIGRHDTAIGKSYLYQGELIGVVIAGEPAPIAPPVTMYFIRAQPIEGAVKQVGI